MGFWSYITGTTPQDEQQAGLDAEKAKYDAALQARQDAGTITPDQVAADKSYENGLSLKDTTAAAQQGFQEGLQEGWNNVLNAPGKAVGAIGGSASQLLGGILKNIPWWAYLAAAVFAFFYFGGFLFLARRLRR